MSLTNKNRSTQKTVLVVDNDAAVAGLLKGILQNDCRVFVAADAGSALRLLTVFGGQIDLAIVNRGAQGTRAGRLREQMKKIVPNLRFLSIAGYVQDEVIRLKVLDASKERVSDSFVQHVRDAFHANEAGLDHSLDQGLYNEPALDACIQASGGNV